VKKLVAEQPAGANRKRKKKNMRRKIGKRFSMTMRRKEENIRSIGERGEKTGDEILGCGGGKEKGKGNCKSVSARRVFRRR